MTGLNDYMRRETPAQIRADNAAELIADDWHAMWGQLDSLRAFWRLRVDVPPANRTRPCGHAWIADYGPLPCALPRGHKGRHRCYGSQGPIDFGQPEATP